MRKVRRENQKREVGQVLTKMNSMNSMGEGESPSLSSPGVREILPSLKIFNKKILKIFFHVSDREMLYQQHRVSAVSLPALL